MMNLLMHAPNFDGRIPNPAIIKAPGRGPLWTGKQVRVTAGHGGARRWRFRRASSTTADTLS